MQDVHTANPNDPEIIEGRRALWMKIPPIVARHWLREFNEKNRHPSKPRIQRYARDLRAGNWMWTGESIKFSRSGLLLDGQNRLHTAIEAECPIHTLVVFGLEEDAQEKMDLGKPRNARDVLTLRGYKNASRLAAAAKLVNRYERGTLNTGSASSYPTVPETIDTVERHPDLEAYASWSNRFDSPHTVRHGRYLAALIYLFSQRDNELSGRFGQHLLDGSEFPAGSVPSLLRERLIQNAQKKVNPSKNAYSESVMLAFIIKGWNYTVEGRDLEVLLVNSRESFPEIQG